MNYRHQFHAGNFGDVMKHALLVALWRALQRKEKGLLYLDTHAGRGRYDLAAAATGDSLARRPEWPEGIGRLWAQENAPPELAEYLGLVRTFDRQGGNLGSLPRFYPGSPAFARLLARPVDRVVLCEQHPAEFRGLRNFAGGRPRTEVREADGYAALRALLPPPERRALVLIDPPFEAADEYARIAAALQEGLTRLASAVFAVWYPLTGRARRDEFHAAVLGLAPPPCLTMELSVAGPDSALRMRGCGLLVVNPPWQFDESARTTLDVLAPLLAQAPGAAVETEWLVAGR